MAEDDEFEISLNDLDELQAEESGSSSSSEEDRMEDVAIEELKPMDAAAIVKLLSSGRLQEHIKKVEAALNTPRKVTHTASIEDDPEYRLIVDSNVLMVEIDNEILSVHKFIRDIYSKKFPELEQLVPAPMDFVRVVKAIGNETDLTDIPLNDVLPAATVMVVVVSATTTPGAPLSPDDLQRVLSACDLALQLDESRSRLLFFIESRMGFIAPNLSAVLGTTIAAKLVGAAGGLATLARTPANTIMGMGAKKRTLAGFSSRGQMLHMGYIFNAEVIQKTPPALRIRGMRLVSGKCALLARIDWGRGSPDASKGREFLQQIAQKIEKWQEPPVGKKLKALPVPIEKGKKKRGGRKARKLKEKLGMTEMRKQMNRIPMSSYGEQGVEETFRETGKGFGMLGQSGSGKIRVAPKDSKSLAKAQKLLNRDAAGTKSRAQISGLTTSLAFTPVQGLELENPLAAQQRQVGMKEKYFGGAAGFFAAPAPKKVKQDTE